MRERCKAPGNGSATELEIVVREALVGFVFTVGTRTTQSCIAVYLYDHRWPSLCSVCEMVSDRVAIFLGVSNEILLLFLCHCTFFVLAQP